MADHTLTSPAAAAPPGLDGLSRLRARLLGQPVGGVADLLGLRVVEIEYGRVAFSCDTDERLANPMGTLHGGILATLLDSAMGCAAHTVLAAGVDYTTVSLEVKLLRPGGLDGETLHAQGIVDHAGRRQITAHGTVTGSGGRLLATATTTCLVLPRKDPTP